MASLFHFEGGMLQKEAILFVVTLQSPWNSGKTELIISHDKGLTETIPSSRASSGLTTCQATMTLGYNSRTSPRG
jgi:hypothetical protein